MLEGHETVKCLFIDQSILSQFRVAPPPPHKASLVPRLPIQDRILRVKKDSLPNDVDARTDLLEIYFTEHLPTATDHGDHWEVLLERPSTPYESYDLDPNIRNGLAWW